MVKKLKKKSSHLTGLFILPNGQDAFGSLQFAGRDTSLHLHHAESLTGLRDVRVIHGELHGHGKVTCLNCVVSSTQRGLGADGRQHHSADVHVDFVATGAYHLAEGESSIRAIQFTTQDIASVFYDFDAFGYVANAGSVIDAVIDAATPNREISVGESPEILYFSGKTEIVSVETVLGIFRVFHRPTMSIGGPEDTSLKNRILVRLEFPNPVTFNGCIERLMSFHRLLSLLAGRRQTLKAIFLELAEDCPQRPLLQLRWSFFPKGAKRGDNRSNDAPHPGDMPLDAIRRPEEFKRVVSEWVSRESGWRTARIRYEGCARKGNSYDVDRLVAAANLFDILPDDAIPPTPELTSGQVRAQTECRAIFRRLPDSPERSSVLGALGRMDKPSLTKKVLYRVEIVNSRLGTWFPDLALAARTAVKIRNYFVHGSLDGLDYRRLEPLMPFLTDSLEFIFAASDLISAGWDAGAWGSRHYSSGHSLTKFRLGYSQHIAALKVATSRANREMLGAGTDPAAITSRAPDAG
jgi:hypothetical protein